MTKKEISTVEEHITYVELYDLEVVTLVAKTAYELILYMTDQYDIDIENDNFIGTVEVVDNPSRAFCVLILLVEEQFSPGLLAHEVYHAVEENIAPHYGLKGEAVAYLLDFIINKNSLALKSQIENWFQNN